MQEGGHSAGRLFALLACYALAGVAWSNTLGCREEDCAEGGYLHGTLACGVGEPDDYVPIINGSGAVDRTVVEGDSCLTASSNLVSWGALCECTSQPGCDGATDCSAQGGHCVANFCPTFTLRIGFTEAGRIELVEPQTDFSFGCRATGGLCVAEACQDLGREVRFEAKPHPGAVIESWTGNPDCEDGVVALDGNVECEVHFRFPEIQVSVTGSGQVIVPPYSVGCREGGGPELCTGAVAIDSYQTLRAIADPGNHLTAWDGACSGTDSEFVLTMDGDKSCTATFSTVSVGSGGSGVIEIVSLADDESLGNDHASDYVFASRLHTLAANADLSVVGFASRASNLLTGVPVPAEAGSTFARSRSPDPSLATTQQISPPQPSNDSSTYTRVSLSADGRYAADVHTSGTPLRTRVYRRDLSADLWEQISTAYPAEVFDDRGFEPKISGNGRYVAYRGNMIAFPANPTSGSTTGIIVRDTCTGAPPAEACTPRSVGVSRRNHPTQPYYVVSSSPSLDISSDGRYVLFGGDIPGIAGTQIFLHDRDSDGDGAYDEAGATSTVSAVSSSDAYQLPFFLDASGRYVVFHSADPSLPDNADAPYSGRAFLRDTCPTWASTPCMPDQLLSVDKYGQPLGLSLFGFDFSQVTDVSASGRYVALWTDNHRTFADEESEEGQPVAVVRDTCLGAPAGCTPTNRPVSLRTDGQLISGVNLEALVSDDGTLAAFYGSRNALIAQPNGHLFEVLLSVTGFAPEAGGTPVIDGRSPSSVSVGSLGFLLRVTGDGFVPGATVTWSTRHPVLAGVWITQTLATSFVSPQRLEAQVTGADVDEAGLVLVRVANPGGATSSPVSITVSGS
jgi:hypothetical protein